MDEMTEEYDPPFECKAFFEKLYCESTNFDKGCKHIKECKRYNMR